MKELKDVKFVKTSGSAGPETEVSRLFQKGRTTFFFTFFILFMSFMSRLLSQMLFTQFA